jgi:hypothetical protein
MLEKYLIKFKKKLHIFDFIIYYLWIVCFYFGLSYLLVRNNYFPNFARHESNYLYILIFILHIINLFSLIKYFINEKIIKYKKQIILILFLFSSSYFLRLVLFCIRFFLHNYNYFYKEIIIIPLILFQITITTFSNRQRINDQSLKSSSSKLEYLYFLFCIPPLLNYFYENKIYFNMISGFIYFGFLSILPLFLIVISKIICSKLKIIFNFSSLITISIWLIYSRPAILAFLKIPIEESVLIQFFVLIMALFLANKLHNKNAKAIPIIGTLIIFFIFIQNYIKSIFFVNDNLNTHMQTLDYGKDQIKKIPKFTKKPNIYFLVYDSYVDEKMMLKYGIDNSRQMQYLQSLGFKFYPESYSAFPATLGSISRILDMNSFTTKPLAGNNLVNTILQKNGYTTNLVVWPYFLQGLKDKSPYSFVYPTMTKVDGLMSILYGLQEGEFKARFVYEETNYFKWLSAKDKILSSNSSTPNFLYTHSSFPSHTQISGRCLPNEEKRYSERLAVANKEMTSNINTILKNNPNSIIIIAGDHGPHIFGDCFLLENIKKENVTALELLDRYGVFLAIKWPDNIKEPVSAHQLQYLPNLFYHVFDALGENKYPERLQEYTYGLGATIPSRNPIKNGIIQFGKDSGKKLYSPNE